MKARTLALFTFVMGLLLTIYLGWALHRSFENVFASHWPRPWPYPDEWLAHWEHQMDIAHPPPPGPYMKLDGEWQRQWIYLYGLIGLSLTISFGGFIRLIRFQADRWIWFGIALTFFAASWFIPIMGSDSVFDVFHRYGAYVFGYYPVIFLLAVISIVFSWVVQCLIVIMRHKLRDKRPERFDRVA
jgi:hypothetical protein